jgi:hypothetical protein
MAVSAVVAGRNPWKFPCLLHLLVNETVIECEYLNLRLDIFSDPWSGDWRVCDEKESGFAGRACTQAIPKAAGKDLWGALSKKID